MRDALFSPKFSNARGILARAIFRQLSDVRNGGRSQRGGVRGQLVTGEPQRTGISRLRKANLTFQ